MISFINSASASSKMRTELAIEFSNVGIFGDFNKRSRITENQ